MKIILILPVLLTFNQNVVNDLFQNTKKSLIKIKYRNNNIQNLRQDNPN